jgi:hypothetical protein
MNYYSRKKVQVDYATTCGHPFVTWRLPSYTRVRACVRAMKVEGTNSWVPKNATWKASRGRSCKAVCIITATVRGCINPAVYSNSMLKVLSSKADSCSDGQKTLRLHGTRRFTTVFTKSRKWILFWVNYIHSTFSRTVSLWSILILLSSFFPRSSKLSLPLRFSDSKFERISHLPHARYTSHPSIVTNNLRITITTYMLKVHLTFTNVMQGWSTEVLKTQLYTRAQCAVLIHYDRQTIDWSRGSSTKITSEQSKMHDY